MFMEVSEVKHPQLIAIDHAHSGVKGEPVPVYALVYLVILLRVPDRDTLMGE